MEAAMSADVLWVGTGIVMVKEELSALMKVPCSISFGLMEREEGRKIFRCSG
jgi:hypothetical protein